MKRAGMVMLLLAGVAAGAAQCWALAHCTDLQVGLLLEESLWWRYGVLLALAALCCAGWALSAKRPCAWEQENWLLTALLFVVGLVLCGGSAARIVPIVRDGLLQNGLLLGGLQLLSGIWFLFMGLHRIAAGNPTVAGVFGMCNVAFFIVLLMPVFLTKMGSLYYVGPVTELLALLAAMLLAALLPRALLFPASLPGKGASFGGLFCFYMCTCLYFPQVVFRSRLGLVELNEWLLAWALGLLGLLGAALAFSGVSDEAAPNNVKERP